MFTLDDVKIKIYSVSKRLQHIYPENKFLYTIDVYTEARIWYDGLYDISEKLEMERNEYCDFMLQYFDCKLFENKLYFKSKSECQKAIDSFENLIIITRLTT